MEEIKILHQRYDREEALSRPGDIFIFTDNTDRDSGTNVVSRDSTYYRQYGDGTHDLHYPNKTTAVLRGLENALPVSTQRYYHEGAKGPEGRWWDRDEAEFRSVVGAETKDIRRRIIDMALDPKRSAPLQVILPENGFLAEGPISQITQERTPRLYAFLKEQEDSITYTTLLFNALFTPRGWFTNIKVPALRETVFKNALKKAEAEPGFLSESTAGLIRNALDTNPAPEAKSPLERSAYMTASIGTFMSIDSADREKIFSAARSANFGITSLQSLLRATRYVEGKPINESEFALLDAEKIAFNLIDELPELSSADRKAVIERRKEIARLEAEKRDARQNAESIQQEQIKERLKEVPIAEVLRYLTGHEFRIDHSGMTRSPFREEKNGSFHIDAANNRWYDHGESRGGDNIKLITEYRHCSYGEALHVLSEIAGLPMPESFRRSASNKGAGKAAEEQLYDPSLKPVNIWFAADENAILSNFAARPFVYGDVRFRSVEQAYQYQKAQKAGDLVAAKKILEAQSSFEANMLGRNEVKLSDEAAAAWDRERAEVMRELMYRSFRYNWPATEALLLTGKARLTHVQAPEPWRSLFPRLLMELRAGFAKEIVSSTGESTGYTKGSPLQVVSVKRITPASTSIVAYAASRGIPLSILRRYCLEFNYTFTNNTAHPLTALFFPNSGPQDFSTVPPNVQGEVRGLPYTSRSGEAQPGRKQSHGPKRYTVIGPDGKFVPEDKIDLQGKVIVFEGFFDAMSYLAWNGKVTPQDYTLVILNSTSMSARFSQLLSDRITELHCILDNDESGRQKTECIRDMAAQKGIPFKDESASLLKDFPGVDLNKLWCMVLEKHPERKEKLFAMKENEKAAPAISSPSVSPSPSAPSGTAAPASDEAEGAPDQAQTQTQATAPAPAAPAAPASGQTAEAGQGPLAGYQVFSGGAVGADTAWGEAMAKEGATVFHYYHGKPTPNGNSPVPEDLFKEGVERVRRTGAQRGIPEASYMKYIHLLARNWAQVKPADAVYAVGTIDASGNVKGGTAWAVCFATEEKKPVYFLRQDTGEWFERDYRGETPSWKAIAVPPPIPPKAALIGSRDIHDGTLSAIAALVKRTVEARRQKKTHKR